MSLTLPLLSIFFNIIFLEHLERARNLSSLLFFFTDCSEEIELKKLKLLYWASWLEIAIPRAFLAGFTRLILVVPITKYLYPSNYIGCLYVIAYVPSIYEPNFGVVLYAYIFFEREKHFKVQYK